MSQLKRRYTFIDLFAGCGGFSLGLKLAGWRGLFAIERNPMAFSSLAANFLSDVARERHLSYDWPPFLPQQPLAVEDLLRGKWANDVLALRGTVDLITGGPPCQGFSFSGMRRQGDPRNRMIEAYADVVLALRPRLILVENVPGILVPHGKKRRLERNPLGIGRRTRSYAERLSELLDSDYLFVRDTVNAAEVGVPQKRARFFGVGIRRDLAGTGVSVRDNSVREAGVNGASPSSSLDPFQVLRSLRRWFLESKGLKSDGVSVAEAIGDFIECRGKRVRECRDPESPPGFKEIAYEPPLATNQNPFVRLMRNGMNGQVPDSLRLARHSDAVSSRFKQILDKCPRGVRLNDENRWAYSTTLKHRIVPLHPDEPSHTVTTLPDDLLHYSEPRILTVRECARLQSFPDWFMLKGKFTTGGSKRRQECPRYTQVGNAVPPLLAEAWGHALARVLQALEERNGGVRRRFP